MADQKPIWVEDAEEELRKYYGEPVRRVSEYCEALRDWARVVVEEHQADQGDTRFDPMFALALAMTQDTPIRKSCLLNRLIYMGQKLRTEKCPIHKGHWSGYGTCQNDPPCHLAPGYDVTGWLPATKADVPATEAVWRDIATGEIVPDPATGKMPDG